MGSVFVNPDHNTSSIVKLAPPSIEDAFKSLNDFYNSNVIRRSDFELLSRNYDKRVSRLEKSVRRSNWVGARRPTKKTKY